MKRIALTAVLASLHSGIAHANAELDGRFPQSSIVIEASHHACYRFHTYLAEDHEQWQRGLMHVRDLDPLSGMLFVYADDAVRSMWMKNTLIPLDMLFIERDGTIESIAAGTVPLSLASVRSGGPVRYVLELNAGTAARLQIEAGDALLWAGDAVGLPSEH